MARAGRSLKSRLRRLDDGRYEYSPKKGTAFILTAEALVRRLVALLPPARLHLTSHHGAYAPNATLRPLVTQPPPQQPPAPTPSQKGAVVPAPKPKRPRLDWAQLHQRTFGTDVLQCPCGGRRTIRSLHSTRKQAFGPARRTRPSAPLAATASGHRSAAVAPCAVKDTARFTKTTAVTPRVRPHTLFTR